MFSCIVFFSFNSNISCIIWYIKNEQQIPTNKLDFIVITILKLVVGLTLNFIFNDGFGQERLCMSISSENVSTPQAVTS